VFDDDLPLVRALRGESLDNVVMVVRRAGSTAGKFLNVTGRPIRDREGRIYGGVAVFYDVTRGSAGCQRKRRPDDQSVGRNDRQQLTHRHGFINSSLFSHTPKNDPIAREVACRRALCPVPDNHRCGLVATEVQKLVLFGTVHLRNLFRPMWPARFRQEVHGTGRIQSSPLTFNEFHADHLSRAMQRTSAEPRM
jgi:hypothetical protein